MANTDFSVLLKAELDRAGIDTDLKKVQEIVKKYHLELTPDLQTASLKNQFKSVCKEMTNDFNKAFNANVSGNDVFKVYENKAKQLQQTLQQANKIQLSFDTGSYQSKVDSLVARTNQWVNANGEARISTESLQTALSNLGTAYNNLNSSGGNTIANQQALIEAEKALDVEVKRVQSSVTKMNAEYAKSSKVESLHQKLTEFYDKNSATHKKWGNELKQMMDATASGAKVANSELSRMELRYKQIGNEARQAGKLGLSFFDGIVEQAKKFTQWVSITTVVMEGVQAFREATSNVIELDTKMVELSKVSDLTAQGLEDVTNQCYDLGESLSKTGTDVLDAVTEFKRAGYDIADSMEYAEEALKTSNISENLKDASQNADSLVNIMKGFQNETPEFAKKINDAVNQVSNTEAVNFDNLIDGATRLSAVADQAGLSFEQMLGTLTGGYEILGNMEKVATGQITIFSRLQAIQLDGEEEVSTVAKLQEKFSNATKGAVNIVDQTSGQLRNVYDILDDLAGVWDSLDKNTREALAIEAAGVRQKQVFLALMQNWKGVEDAVDSAKNSIGSADEENEKYINSIQGKLENLESATQKLSKTLIDSDLIKFFVDLGTTGVKAIDGLVNALTPLGAAGLIGGGILGGKNIGKTYEYTVFKLNCFEYALYA